MDETNYIETHTDKKIQDFRQANFKQIRITIKQIRWIFSTTLCLMNVVQFFTSKTCFKNSENRHTINFLINDSCNKIMKFECGNTKLFILSTYIVNITI